jgi:predicted DNA-binding transcriptional regulator YafY
MRKSERLFALAEALRARRTGTTAAELAERFGVSVRTVMRDLDALRAAHVPIASERGRGGGVHLDKSYSMPPVSFTAKEAQLLLVLGRYADEMRVVPMLETLRSALDKVRAALPPDRQRELVRLQKRLSIVGVPAHPVDAAVRRAVERAWFEERELVILYRKSELDEIERRVRIESVVLERTETLLNCIDLDLDDKRQFRLHRVIKARLADNPGRA